MLRAQLERLEQLRPQLGGAAGGSGEPAAGGSAAADAEELHAVLTAGLQHCLFWLYGLELPGLDSQEEWGGGFEVRPAAAVL